MSMPSWKDSLRQLLRQSKKTAVIGLGNELCGDDAVGPMTVRRLQNGLSDYPNLMLIDAGLAPENFTGPLRRFQPEAVIMIDAAAIGDEPGAISWLSWQDAAGCSASTHTMPLTLLGRYLLSELDCTLAVIGVQPVNINMGDFMSAPVGDAVEALLAGFTEALPSAKGTVG